RPRDPRAEDDRDAPPFADERDELVHPAAEIRDRPEAAEHRDDPRLHGHFVDGDAPNANAAHRRCAMRRRATSSGRVQCIMWPASAISARTRFGYAPRRSSSSGGCQPVGPPETYSTGHATFFANSLKSALKNGIGDVV